MNNINLLPPVSENGTSGTFENNHLDELYKNVLLHGICSEVDGNCSKCQAHCHGEIPLDERNIVEVNCKGLLGLSYCIIPAEFKDEIHLDDVVIISFNDTVEVATVKELNDIIKVKRQKFGLSGEDLPVLLRKKNEEDVAALQKNRQEEEKAIEVFKVKVVKYNLNMKLIDVHYQFDRNKLYFFYTAEGRVDFRELAKDLASNFRTRIELRQIGVRDEAKRIGGLGTCGREFCCSAFLENFKKITTQLASDQNLASGLSKMSGPCGKLKCCLSFENEVAPQESSD